jgi:hypothetical protein
MQIFMIDKLVNYKLFLFEHNLDSNNFKLNVDGKNSLK